MTPADLVAVKAHGNDGIRVSRPGFAPHTLAGLVTAVGQQRGISGNYRLGCGTMREWVLAFTAHEVTPIAATPSGDVISGCTEESRWGISAGAMNRSASTNNPGGFLKSVTSPRLSCRLRRASMSAATARAGSAAHEGDEFSGQPIAVFRGEADNEKTAPVMIGQAAGRRR
jgi:hypothetical protein